MKKHLYTITIILLFVVGFSVLLYPAISDYINEKHASHIIVSYNDALSHTDQSERDALFQQAQDYNKSLAADSAAFYDPSRISGYTSILDITGEGVMGYIDIDKIHVQLPIYHGTDKSVLQIGAGHVEGSSLPVGGSSTHCLLSGHRGLPSAKLFTDLDELEIGDRFTITILDRVLTYEVDQIKTVLPDESQDLTISPGRDMCTLITCTPYGINTHRLLVRGVRVENDEEKAAAVVFVPNEAFRIDTIIVAPVAAIPMLFILLIITLIVGGRKNKRRK
ncbi:MAG: class C sortase [Ruminococcus sp.]|nr:class C sortase [Ruminococcus sp.]